MGIHNPNWKAAFLIGSSCIQVWLRTVFMLQHIITWKIDYPLLFDLVTFNIKMFRLFQLVFLKLHQYLTTNISLHQSKKSARKREIDESTATISHPVTVPMKGEEQEICHVLSYTDMHWWWCATSSSSRLDFAGRQRYSKSISSYWNKLWLYIQNDTGC